MRAVVTVSIEALMEVWPSWSLFHGRDTLYASMNPENDENDEKRRTPGPDRPFGVCFVAHLTTDNAIVQFRQLSEEQWVLTLRHTLLFFDPNEVSLVRRGSK